MSTDKKFYWIKLRTDFFNRSEVDFLLSQQNGDKYVILYLLLCLNTANNNGLLSVKINELIVPYNVDKIVRDTKYFDYDTVVVALELYRKLGLIYEEKDNILKIANFEEMVGSETSSAKRVREYRERKKMLQCNTDVTQDIDNRDKRLENNRLDYKNNYDCHLNKPEKDSFCLNCQKKNVCNKKTSDIFYQIYGMSFEDYINNSKSWKLVGKYIDEGISATGVDKRKSFLAFIFILNLLFSLNDSSSI